MYEPHEAFDSPDDPDTRIWRYMDFAKLVDVLESERLFFSRADKLGDPFEGSYSEANLRLRPEMYGEHAAELTAQFSVLMREMPRYTIVSCWHQSDYESAAMWEKYAAAGYPIAVQSTFARFTSSLQCEERVYAGVVKYVDYVQDVIPESNTFYPFLHKRLSFEHEREIRAIMQGIPWDEDNNLDFTKESWEAGRAVPVDTNTLVEAIHVAPFAPEWFIALVDRLQGRLGLSFPVRKSDMERDPVY
jgi:hypothetical protein